MLLFVETYIMSLLLLKLEKSVDSPWLIMLHIWIDLECVAGKYGKNCSQDCSRHCNDSMACDKKTGVCDGGCVDGWKWLMCNIGALYHMLKA